MSETDHVLEIEVKSGLFAGPQKLIINDQSIQYGSKKLSCREVKEIRYGIIQNTSYGAKTARNYVMVIKDKMDQKISIAFSSVFGIKEDQQNQKWSSIINAIWYNITSRIVNEWYDELLKGKSVKIGRFEVTPKGVLLTHGIIFKKTELIPWKECIKWIHNGHFFIGSSEKKSKRAGMSLLNTFNLVVLDNLLAWLWEEGRVYKMEEAARIRIGEPGKAPTA